MQINASIDLHSCLFTAGGPKRLRVLLEGEALLNDASSFTLFEIFLHLVEQLNEGSYHDESGWAVLWSIIKSALKLAGGDCPPRKRLPQAAGILSQPTRLNVPESPLPHYHSFYFGRIR